MWFNKKQEWKGNAIRSFWIQQIALITDGISRYFVNLECCICNKFFGFFGKWNDGILLFWWRPRAWWMLLVLFFFFFIMNYFQKELIKVFVLANGNNSQRFLSPCFIFFAKNASCKLIISYLLSILNRNFPTIISVNTNPREYQIYWIFLLVVWEGFMIMFWLELIIMVIV